MVDLFLIQQAEKNSSSSRQMALDLFFFQSFSHAFKDTHYHGIWPAVHLHGQCQIIQSCLVNEQWTYLQFQCFVCFYFINFLQTDSLKCVQIQESNQKSNWTQFTSDVIVNWNEERTMNCPFSVIMVPVLCPSQVQYYDNWILAVPSQCTPPPQVMLMNDKWHSPSL